MSFGHIGAGCWRGRGSVTLTGGAKVCTDAETRRAMWQGWLVNHFPGGVDGPNCCVIGFIAREATIWIDKEFVTLPIQGFHDWENRGIMVLRINGG